MSLCGKFIRSCSGPLKIIYCPSPARRQLIFANIYFLAGTFSIFSILTVASLLRCPAAPAPFLVLFSPHFLKLNLFRGFIRPCNQDSSVDAAVSLCGWDQAGCGLCSSRLNTYSNPLLITAGTGHLKLACNLV